MPKDSTQPNSINIWIKEYREKHQLSKSDFAAICGISSSIVDEIESGTIKYPFEYLLNFKKNLSSDESTSFSKAVAETVKNDFSKVYS